MTLPSSFLDEEEDFLHFYGRASMTCDPIDDIRNYGGQTEIPLEQQFAHEREK
jgi:hypothetical protein